MDVYDYKYLREKVNRIISKQREGKNIIAADKHGARSALPGACVGNRKTLVGFYEWRRVVATFAHSERMK